MGARAAETPQARSSSDLTFGSNVAMCGSIFSALRNRKKALSVDTEKPPSPEQMVTSPAVVLPHEREAGTEKSPEVNIMVINHDDSPSGYISGDGSPPISPVVYDEAEGVDADA